MRTRILVLALLLFCTSGSVIAGSDFDRLKALEGQWEATTPEGKTRITYQLISNGSALLETIVSHNMVSVYHSDGAALLMTHYCAAGNQPRMRARPSSSDTIAFQYVDAANLKSSSEGHMYRLVIKFKDANHVTQVWTWKEGGKETNSTFQLERAK